MSVYMRAVFAVLPLFVGVSCAFKKDSSEEKNRKNEIVQGNATPDILSSSDLSVEFVPLNSFGRYSARISWPEEKRIQFSLKYAVEPKGPNLVFKTELIDTRTVKSFDVPCTSGAISSPEVVFSYATGVAPVRLEMSIKCPVDLRISGNYAAVDYLANVDGRLFIDDQTIIHLEDKKLDLNLIDLVVQGSATIESQRAFRAGNFDDGRAEVRIRAKRAFGEIYLKLRGLSGRNGKDGRDLQIEDSEYQDLLKNTVVANGVAGSPGQSTLSSRGRDASPVVRCVRPPGNGGKGQDGKVAGKAGGDGEAGGPSSRVNIAIIDISDFRLGAVVEPGAPGRGGLGGPGQNGGSGGAPGANVDGCPPASAGPSGNPAAHGSAGLSGEQGACGEIALSENFRGLFHPRNEGKAENCKDKAYLKWIPLKDLASPAR